MMLGALCKVVGVRGAFGLALGLMVMAGYERAPWGLAARLDRSDSARTRAALALTRAGGALTLAADQIRARDKAMKSNGRGEALDAAATAQFWKGQCRAAYDAGYASRSCSGPAADDRVRDLQGLWSAGAYTGRRAAGLPGQPGG
ncbi:hypothetical protein CSW58_06070 [Caulobacter sp. B11]|nr:hypothetical protein CSW58_06070 [Caulobacter sp. B11]